jgi:transcriptional regulator with XRE-family HTH domain
MTTTVQAIAENVFTAREAAGVTRKAMAHALGVTATTLWRKETGGTEFKASELIAIASVCGVDVGRLLAVGVDDGKPEAGTVNIQRGG